ncbi:MAG TPA: type I secretion system permease/ATPase [Beijerinckiaceae bacterium]
MSHSINPDPRARARSELNTVLASCRHAFVGIGLMSGMINLLYLTGSFFMLEIYDRVLPSRSVPTLVGLAVIAFVLYAFQGVLDLLRGRVLVRIGASLDEALNRRVFDLLVRLPLKTRTVGDGLQPVRDLDQVRAFLSSLGPAALFDLPWMPLYLGICFLFHFWIGVTALVGAIVLVAITLLTEMRTREPTRAASMTGQTRNALAEASRRNAEVLQAMGMGGRVAERWREANAKYMASQQRASDVAGGMGAISKVLRMALQSAVLGVGAYLVIEQQATAGIIIASSILTSRALAPVELAIANWRGFVAARQSWRRLTELFAALPVRGEPMALPRPSAAFAVEGVSATPPGGQRFVVQDVTFALKAGNGLGIIGPSASGKSSLARLLVGVWTPIRGKVRLDGAAIEQWDPEALGRHVGYLPQDVELFAGTVADNIARFEPEPDAEAVLEAAKAANVHDLILRLPDGYDTQIGEGGTALSAGQRQRIALARALYRDPFLIVLDEPNSNLDAEGEQALTQAILGARARGRIVVVIAHRPSALAGVDLILMLADGKAQAFGPKDEVLSKVLRRPAGSAGAEAGAGTGAHPGTAVLKVVEAQAASGAKS